MRVVDHADIVIVGGGAAGLATAIFTARRLADRSILILDGAKKLGARILVSGGGRCNVTNARVSTADFHGGSSNVVRRVLSAFTEGQTVEFFRELGVTLHEEEHGKLFPDSHRARTVLDALMGEARGLNVSVRTDHRVKGIDRTDGGFRVVTSAGVITGQIVVLATGGLSLPKTGSDGGGYAMASALGHLIVPTTPALVPFVLEGAFHVALAGVSQEVELTVETPGEKPMHLRGSMLWAHFGVSGPVVLDASRHWHAAQLKGDPVRVKANFLPGRDFASAEKQWLQITDSQPRIILQTAMSTLLPARMAAALLANLGLDGRTTLAHLSRDDRRKLLHALLDWDLPIHGSRGFGYAEVTAGGVPLNEVDPATLESRKCPGLFIVGEILDVDGRIGGFNFQWSWSSAWVAAMGIERMIGRAPGA